MRISFKRMLSIVLALLMLVLAIPAGLTVTAEDASESSVLLEQYKNSIVTEKTADFVYIVDGTDDAANYHFKNLEDAIMTARNATSKTYFIKVLTDLTANSKDSAGNNINFSINFSVTIDGSAASTKPVVTLGNVAQASYWLCAGNGTTPVVTIRNIDFDCTNLKRTDGTTASNPFTTRGGTLILDNCVIDEPTSTTVFQNNGSQKGNLVCVDTKIVSDLKTLAPATKSCVDFTSGSNVMNVSLENCTFVTTGAVAVRTTSNGKDTVKIYGGTYKCASNAVRTATGDTCYIYDGYFETTADDSVTMAPSGKGDITNKPSDISTNMYPAVGENVMNIYGGYFVNSADDSNNAQVFVARPWDGAAVNIYGGTFVSTCDAAVIGAGATGSTGYVTVYGGTFIKSGTTGENLMTNYFNGAADKWGAKYYYLYGGTYYTAKADDNTAYRLSTHSQTTYNRAYSEVEYSAKPSAPQTVALAGRDGTVGTADDITAAWVDICTITRTVTEVKNQVGDTKTSHKFYELADAITEKNADYVYVVDGVGNAEGTYANLDDAITAARALYEANKKATHYIKLMASVEAQGISNNSINFDLTIDGSHAQSKPVITVGDEGTSASYWFCAGTNTTPTVTLKNINFDFSDAGRKGTTEKSDGLTSRGGTLIVKDCVIVEPANSSKYVFQSTNGYDQTIVCLDTKVVSSFDEGATSKKTLAVFTASNTKRSMYLDGCEITTSAGKLLSLDHNSKVDLHVYGGTYKTTANGANVIFVGANTQAYIYGGEFETTGTGAVTIAASQNNKVTSVPADPDVHAPDGVANVYIYGGTIKATGNSSAFCLRPYQGGCATVYGGTFEAPNGATVIGAGESMSHGYLYIYGGTFVKSATSGASLLNHGWRAKADGADWVNWKDKYYYIYGGTFYTAMANDNRGYRCGAAASANHEIAASSTLFNRAYGEVIYTDIDKTYNGKTYVDAVKVSMKTPEGVKYAEDLFASTYQQVTTNTTASSAKTNLRLVVEVKTSELDRFNELGFFVSSENATAIDRAELDNSVEKIADKGNIHYVYMSVVQNGAKTTETYARDGYSFVVLEIKDIDNSDFNKNVYFRVYAKEKNATTGETVIHLGEVKTAGVYKSLG